MTPMRDKNRRVNKKVQDQKIIFFYKQTRNSQCYLNAAGLYLGQFRIKIRPDFCPYIKQQLMFRSGIDE